MAFFSTDVDKITLQKLPLAELLDGASQVGSDLQVPAHPLGHRLAGQRPGTSWRAVLSSSEQFLAIAQTLHS
ncbi:MAG: hypothetical protein EBT99_15985, partial [Betaproteobacteria bacterium]|nr:hypothetical protein [Betaproteobacteria bacterium]